MNKLIVPVPCTEVEEKTVRQWFAKLDEEVNEFKAAVLRLYELDEDAVAIHNDLPAEEEELEAERRNVALEGADVCTVIHSTCETIGIGLAGRMEAQLDVNKKNKELGRI